MTRAEAVKEAVRRWGPQAGVFAHGGARDAPCMYGCLPWVSGGYGPSAPFGEGRTFEEAFADADRRSAVRTTDTGPDGTATVDRVMDADGTIRIVGVSYKPPEKARRSSEGGAR